MYPSSEVVMLALTFVISHLSGSSCAVLTLMTLGASENHREH
jgi:hypothetical protein